ncbi:MAG: DUF2752 domain-containing protein [Planctomycetota bacterium]|nr:DUF2752 domain-containing protein [Planctomycetaceae bacterium]MDQ3331101.1 DUF2752 domain-containing protein [Planctomycetota bacterium]
MAACPHDFEAVPLQRGRSERIFHAVLLCLAISVPVLGALMTTQPAGEVALAGFEAYPLPTLCASRWLGIECATCGVTRSIIAFMHGEVAASLSHHRFGWLILLFIVAQAPYRTYKIVRPEQRLPRLEWMGIAALLMIGIIVVANRFAEVLSGP